MKVIHIKHLPNILTVTRVVLSLALLVLLQHPLAFAAVYLCAGASDMTDGYIARRYKLETSLGAKLDSLADFIFFAVILTVLFRRFTMEPYFWAGIAVIFVIRVVNFVITRARFTQWGMMHTIGNKAAGLLLFLFVPVCVWMGRFPLSFALLAGTAAALSALEETAILLTAKEYDINRKSMFIRYTA